MISKHTFQIENNLQATSQHLQFVSDRDKYTGSRGQVTSVLTANKRCSQRFQTVSSPPFYNGIVKEDIRMLREMQVNQDAGATGDWLL